MGTGALADALDELAHQLGPPARPVVDALVSADRYGHPLGPALERLADHVRAERRRQAEADARLARQGPNALPEAQPPGAALRFLRHRGRMGRPRAVVAHARQCTHARSHACVSSQMTSQG